MKNKKVVDIFRKIANLLAIKGENSFKVNAYKRAADLIEGLGEKLDLYVKEDKLSNIPGIGSALSEKIKEIYKTDDCKFFKELTKELPLSLIDLLSIPGIGPKTVAKLYYNLNINNIQTLEEFAKQGKLHNLKGLGKKLEEKILYNIEKKHKYKNKHLLGQVLPIAQNLKKFLLSIKGVKKVEIAGSIRRFKDLVSDLDILLITDLKDIDFVNFIKSKYKSEIEIVNRGDTKITLLYKENNLQIDIRIIKEDSFGSALAYFTGSKAHNVVLRDIAKKRNLKINEYGIFDENNNKIGGKKEEDIYDILSMQYIPAVLRENQGEIELAKIYKLPKLIQLSDIKGDLHVHTSWSDGYNSIEEMVEKAIKLGYEYIAITDHSRSQKLAGGLDEKILLKQIDYVNNLKEKYKDRIFILIGSEVDIKKDGTLDFSDEILSKLDIVIASVHTGFEMSEKDMTERVLKALKNPFVNILAHPTGRLLLKRDAYLINIEKIIEFAKENYVALEVNSFFNRLDLKDIHIKMVNEAGGFLAIDTDSHSIFNLEEMIVYGVKTAQRGWTEKKNVINTYSYFKLKEFLEKRRKLK